MAFSGNPAKGATTEPCGQRAGAACDRACAPASACRRETVSRAEEEIRKPAAQPTAYDVPIYESRELLAAPITIGAAAAGRAIPSLQLSLAHPLRRDTEAPRAPMAPPALPATVPALAVLLLCLLVVLAPAAEAARSRHRSSGGDAAAPTSTTTGGGGCNRPPLWVFGDSYADTGNLGDLGRELTHAWYDPYGDTFPGRPTGRFSDGRVLTDFIASAMGVPTPVAYKLRRSAPPGLLARGMNFAVGGAGVLDTGNFQRNISAQIDLFQAQHPPSNRSGGCDAAGVAVVVVSGNDYSYAADKDNSTSAAIAYIPTVVRHLREQLRRLRDEAGMRRVVVTNLHPLGCTPLFTRALNYTGCDPLANAGAAQHNAALESVLAGLDPANQTFLLLDINAPFAAVVDAPSPAPAAAGEGRFEEPRRPCCETLGSGGYCGQQDDDGKRMYTLCDDPGKHFYWDDVHPTQAAWAAVAETFRPKIREFLLSST